MEKYLYRILCDIVDDDLVYPTLEEAKKALEGLKKFDNKVDIDCNYEIVKEIDDLGIFTEK